MRTELEFKNVNGVEGSSRSQYAVEIQLKFYVVLLVKNIIHCEQIEQKYLRIPKVQPTLWILAPKLSRWRQFNV